MHFRTAALSCLALAAASCGQPAQDYASDDAGNPASAPAAEATTLTASARPGSFAQCAACHAVEAGRNGLGPTLAGVFDAEAGHVGDYAYSDAMRESGLIWDAATLDRYLENPRQTVPGTKMSFAGMRDAEKRAQIIDYLKTL